MTPTPETLQSATEKEKEQRQRRADSKELQKQASAREASRSSSKGKSSIPTKSGWSGGHIYGKKGSNKNNFLPSLKTQKMNTIDNDMNLSATKR